MKDRKIHYSKLIVIIFLIATVLLPLLRLFFYINVEDIITLFTSKQFKMLLFNSVSTTLISTIISVSLAFILAFSIHRTNIKFKQVFIALFTAPMFIPSISHGMGLVFLLGDNGLLTNLFGINIGLYGYKGIILGSILYAFPVAFLMLSDMFSYEDFTVYESAKVLGLNKRQQFLSITLPNMKMPLISALFAVFTLVFTDYGVPLIVGGKTMTLSVYMYREVIGLLNFSKGAIIGVVLLIPAFIAFIIDVKSRNVTGSSTVTREFVIEDNNKRDAIAYIINSLAAIALILPIMSFMYLSFVRKFPIDMSMSLINIKKSFNLGVGSYLLNSITIALLTSLIGIVITYFTAYLTARSKDSLSNHFLHLMAMISLAIPGVVLGLSYVIFFNGSLIYGTIFLLVMVNIVHFFASPYLMAYNSLKKFNQNFEDISQSLGISSFSMLKDVYIPSTVDTITEMFGYMFVNAMVTISAVSFVATLRNMPLSLLIPQFDSQSLIEATAFIAVLIFSVNIIAKSLIYLFKKNIKKFGGLNHDQ